MDAVFRIESDDGSNTLVQMFVGESHGVADEELFGARARWRRFLLSRGCGGIEENRRIQHCPSAASYVVLYDRLRMSQLGDSAFQRGPQRVVTDVSDGHPNVQSLTNFESASGVIEHFADGQIEAIYLAGRLPKGVLNRPGFVGDRRFWRYAARGQLHSPIVGLLSLRRRHIPGRAEQPMMVIPLKPFSAASWTSCSDSRTSMHKFRLLQAVDRLGHSIVIGVAQFRLMVQGQRPPNVRRTKC
ncbi:hypothetical protein AWB72_05461 [Caballeronia concitans]|uniref:Uncharacterized protein n=1 Tax=Caballeronia concitans TaxID=1777133 RepID=A0A658R5E6_9BURK|nr:hypothetical protein AWB72_05461 [Caballeronia concitans]